MERVHSKFEVYLGKQLLRLACHWYPDLIQQKVAELSARVADKVVRDFLKEEGILHCCICLKRAPLEKIGDVYCCKEHATRIKNKLVKEEVQNGKALEVR